MSTIAFAIFGGVVCAVLIVSQLLQICCILLFWLSHRLLFLITVSSIKFSEQHQLNLKSISVVHRFSLLPFRWRSWGREEERPWEQDYILRSTQTRSQGLSSSCPQEREGVGRGETLGTGLRGIHLSEMFRQNEHNKNCSTFSTNGDSSHEPMSGIYPENISFFLVTKFSSTSTRGHNRI